MSHLADVLRLRTAKALTDFGLTPRDYGVLWRLATHGPLSQTELGTLHQIDRTTVVAIVDRLEDLELVARAPDPHDRRRHALVLTGDGRDRQREAATAVDRVAADFLAPATPSARRQLSATLTTVLESLER